jgi:hypothetical protein
MLWRSVSIALLLSIFVNFCRALEEEHRQTVAEMREVAVKAAEKNRQVTVLLKTKSERKKEFGGRPEKISEQGFTLVSVRTGRKIEFAFEEVRELRIKGPRVGLFVGLVALAGGAVVAAYILSRLSSD